MARSTGGAQLFVDGAVWAREHAPALQASSTDIWAELLVLVALLVRKGTVDRYGNRYVRAHCAPWAEQRFRPFALVAAKRAVLAAGAPLTFASGGCIIWPRICSGIRREKGAWKRIGQPMQSKHTHRGYKNNNKNKTKTNSNYRVRTTRLRCSGRPGSGGPGVGISEVLYPGGAGNPGI